LSVAERQEIGALANKIKIDVTAKYEEVKREIEGKSGAQNFIDVTLPGKKINRGILIQSPLSKRVGRFIYFNGFCGGRRSAIGKRLL